MQRRIRALTPAVSNRYFSENVRDDYAGGQLDAQVEGVLQEMRELSICGA